MDQPVHKTESLDLLKSVILLNPYFFHYMVPGGSTGNSWNLGKREVCGPPVGKPVSAFGCAYFEQTFTTVINVVRIAMYYEYQLYCPDIIVMVFY